MDKLSYIQSKGRVKRFNKKYKPDYVEKSVPTNEVVNHTNKPNIDTLDINKDQIYNLKFAGYDFKVKIIEHYGNYAIVKELKSEDIIEIETARLTKIS